jgi:NAD(P)-dependent dehydrogenase (short-subunit alcohol dehydrogenase family)
MFLASPQSGIAWVTGASSGIGRAVALELAHRGYMVAATSNAPDGLETLAAEAPPGRIAVHAGDITDPDGMARLVGRIEAEHGPIALAFVNAGGQFHDDPRSFDADIFQRTAALNLGGTANSLAPLLGAMRGRGYGQVAINASSSGYGGLPEAISYGASKAALIHLAESLRLVCSRQGVTIQLVSLGFVRTPLTDLNRFPMPFMILPKQAARRICDGFARGGFEIVVPRRLVWPLKVLNLLPYGLYFPAIRAFTGRQAKRFAGGKKKAPAV